MSGGKIFFMGGKNTIVLFYKVCGDRVKVGGVEPS
jgi:hypothetical protein